MEYQLRIYKLKPGVMDEFAHNWRTRVVPVRKQLGFDVVGAWTSPDTDEFVWMVAFSGPGGFAAAEQAYYASPLRQSIGWDPLPYIEKMELRLLGPIDAGS